MRSFCFDSPTSSFQRITLHRVHLLAPALPAPLPHTADPSHLAWVLNSARNATVRWAVASPPATSPPRPWPAAAPHPPISHFPHSAHPLLCQALPKTFTRTTEKPCRPPLLLDTLSGHAAQSRPARLCSRGCSQPRNCLEYITRTRSLKPPAGTRWKCRFMVRVTCWATWRWMQPVEALTLGSITADSGRTSPAKGFGTLGLSDQSSWL